MVVAMSRASKQPARGTRRAVLLPKSLDDQVLACAKALGLDLSTVVRLALQGNLDIQGMRFLNSDSRDLGTNKR